MAAFRTSKAIDELLQSRAAEDPGFEMDVLPDAAASCCTTGYDNDGSTGYEIFENGFELAQKAGGEDVWVSTALQGQAFFFIGTEEQVLQMLSSAE